MAVVGRPPASIGLAGGLLTHRGDLARRTFGTKLALADR
jgi:hypothetical protein